MSNIISYIIDIFRKKPEESKVDPSLVYSYGEYIRWRKGDKSPIGNTSFYKSEFECHCHFPTCINQVIATSLVDKLEEASRQFPDLVVTSGYRCPAYQKQLAAGGAETARGVSQHELGRAADLTSKQLAALQSYVLILFHAVGIARTFVHVDLRDDKERRWTYK